ncbi:winged helix-turn-helix domain-containing protein [uncultured Methanolobus sp.]|jgi:predicted transcriptional regulator|uniref:winged helix-turn-helix domain-containing protein n=1 Tax=uncultured Methanolobus sp. TaxID=218300 RepID=UPI002AAC1601|nr:winged helix-turn-helix domain-containing protein [uncultured Methanolobus sp.]
MDKVNAGTLKALSNETRQQILQSLSDKDMHIAELAGELGISCTSTSKHVRVLEEANLIERNIFGKSHVLSLKNKKNRKTDSENDASGMELYIAENLFLI